MHYMGASSLKFYDLTVGAFPINSQHTKLQFALWDLLNKSEKYWRITLGAGWRGRLALLKFLMETVGLA